MPEHQPAQGLQAPTPQLFLGAFSPIPGPPVWLGQPSSSPNHLGCEGLLRPQAHTGLAFPTRSPVLSCWGGEKPQAGGHCVAWSWAGMYWGACPEQGVLLTTKTLLPLALKGKTPGVFRWQDPVIGINSASLFFEIPHLFGGEGGTIKGLMGSV